MQSNRSIAFVFIYLIIRSFNCPSLSNLEIYACLEYYTLNSNLQKTNISYHATVIHGVNPETQEFLLYDTQDGTETWYTYTGRNDTYTDSQFLNFCIYKLAALK